MRINTMDEITYAEGLVDFLLDQHFSISVAISNLKGVEEVDWTKCYHTRCRVLADQFRREECKLDCQKRALNVLISKLGGLRGKCRFERNPAACAQRVNDETKAAREKLVQIRQTVTTVKRSKTTYTTGTQPAGGAPAGGAPYPLPENPDCCPSSSSSSSSQFLSSSSSSMFCFRMFSSFLLSVIVLRDSN